MKRQQVPPESSKFPPDCTASHTTKTAFHNQPWYNSHQNGNQNLPHMPATCHHHPLSKHLALVCTPAAFLQNVGTKTIKHDISFFLCVVDRAFQ